MLKQRNLTLKTINLLIYSHLLFIILFSYLQLQSKCLLFGSVYLRVFIRDDLIKSCDFSTQELAFVAVPGYLWIAFIDFLLVVYEISLEFAQLLCYSREGLLPFLHFLLQLTVFAFKRGQICCPLSYAFVLLINDYLSLLIISLEDIIFVGQFIEVLLFYLQLLLELIVLVADVTNFISQSGVCCLSVKDLFL